MTRTFWRFRRDADVRFAAFLAVFVATVAIACDPGAGVTWVDQTDQSVVILLERRT